MKKLKISELTTKEFLSNPGAVANSYVLINYEDNTTEAPVTYKATIDELGKAIANNLQLYKADNSGNAYTMGVSQGAYTNNAAKQFVTAAEKTKIANAVTDISGKVDKVTGKGLSTNDYTDTDKAKVTAVPPTNLTGNPKYVMTAGGSHPSLQYYNGTNLVDLDISTGNGNESNTSNGMTLYNIGHCGQRLVTHDISESASLGIYNRSGQPWEAIPNILYVHGSQPEEYEYGALLGPVGSEEWTVINFGAANGGAANDGTDVLSLWTLDGDLLATTTPGVSSNLAYNSPLIQRLAAQNAKWDTSTDSDNPEYIYASPVFVRNDNLTLCYDIGACGAADLTDGHPIVVASISSSGNYKLGIIAPNEMDNPAYSAIELPSGSGLSEDDLLSYSHEYATGGSSYTASLLMLAEGGLFCKSSEDGPDPIGNLATFDSDNDGGIVFKDLNGNIFLTINSDGQCTVDTSGLIFN